MALLIGFLLALSVGLAARLAGRDRDRAFYPRVLAVVASFYVLFGLVGGSVQTVIVEAAVMAVFLAVTAAGFRLSPWWIVAGLAAHAILDGIHGQVIANPGVPAWWPAFCAAYDLTAAAMLALMLRVPRRLPIDQRTRQSDPDRPRRTASSTQLRPPRSRDNITHPVLN
jgi:hypothetical protein